MGDAPDMLHQLGTFEPTEARKILPVLESHQIPFEVEGDHSALSRPNRALQLYFGLSREGSKLAVYVREPDLPKALRLIEELFPV